MTSFNVAGLLREPPGTVREGRLRDHYVTLGPDLELAGPLDADLRFQRTNRGILVRVSLDEEFLPSIDASSGAPIQRDADEDSPLLIDDHHEIELDGVLHDELALTEPMHPLCTPDCAGLCPTCGQKLDRGDHDHDPGEIDPRLAGLAELLRGGGGEEEGS